METVPKCSKRRRFQSPAFLPNTAKVRANLNHKPSAPRPRDFFLSQGRESTTLRLELSCSPAHFTKNVKRTGHGVYVTSMLTLDRLQASVPNPYAFFLSRGGEAWDLMRRKPRLPRRRWLSPPQVVVVGVIAFSSLQPAHVLAASAFLLARAPPLLASINEAS
jgi:hypothetical protein